MRATINGKYTYEVPEGSQEGDEVELEGANGGRWKGWITSLTSHYEGKVNTARNLSQEAREKPGQ